MTTDGSIEPSDAISQAAEILIRQLAIFTGPIQPLRDVIDEKGDDSLDRGIGPMENFPIEELELGVRSYNCLKRVDRDDRRPRLQVGE